MNQSARNFEAWSRLAKAVSEFCIAEEQHDPAKDELGRKVAEIIKSEFHESTEDTQKANTFTGWTLFTNLQQGDDRPPIEGGVAMILTLRWLSKEQLDHWAKFGTAMERLAFFLTAPEDFQR